jgi:hypothetical protein
MHPLEIQILAKFKTLTKIKNMQKLKMFRSFAYALLALCLVGLHTACKKETDTYDLYPIHLSSVDTLGTIKLSWTKIETSDFIEYVVVRSIKDSIADFNELNTSGGATIIGRVTNAKLSEFLDFVSNSTVNRFYYRVFARLKNRTISSANYRYNSELTILNVTIPSEIIQDEKNPNLVYLNASNTGQITLYDLEKDSILAQSSTVFSSSHIILASDRGANAEIVQVFNNSRKIVFRDAKTLEIKANLDFNYSIYNADGSQDGFICISTDEYNKQFQLIRLSDHKIVSTQSNVIENYPFYSYGNVINKLPNSNTILVAESSSSPSLARLTYDAQGFFTQAKLIGRIQSTSSSAVNKISTKGNYYWLYGQMYAEPLDINKPLNTFIQSNYTDFIFKPDETKFYVMRQVFGNSVSNIIEEYNIVNGKQIRTLTSRILGRMIPFKDKIYVFGGSNNGSNQQTIIQKIQL